MKWTWDINVRPWNAIFDFSDLSPPLMAPKCIFWKNFFILWVGSSYSLLQIELGNQNSVRRFSFIHRCVFWRFWLFVLITLFHSLKNVIFGRFPFLQAASAKWRRQMWFISCAWIRHAYLARSWIMRFKIHFYRYHRFGNLNSHNSNIS